MSKNIVVNTKSKSLNDWAYLAIAQYTDKFTQHEAGVLEDKDPEELHQMRVGMRKLRSAMRGFRSALALPKPVQEKKIGKVARTLGKLRDLDVLLALINQKYLPDLPEDEKSKLEQVLEHIKKTRKKTFQLVKSTLKSKKYKKIKKSLQFWLKKPQFLTDNTVKIEDKLAELLLASIKKFLSHSGWLVTIPGSQSSTYNSETATIAMIEEILAQKGLLLHDLRKEAKRCRYQMELFTQFYGTDYQSYLKQIKNVQTVLGNLQDDAVFSEVLTSTIGENFASQLPALNQKILNDHYQQWQKWQELQSFFAQDSNHQQLFQVINHPVGV